MYCIVPDLIFQLINQQSQPKNIEIANTYTKMQQIITFEKQIFQSNGFKQLFFFLEMTCSTLVFMHLAFYNAKNLTIALHVTRLALFMLAGNVYM